MEAPFFEPDTAVAGQNGYPVSCHIQHYGASPQMCRAHWHYAIEVLYATRGSASVLLNGQFYAFSEGDMVLISARDVHAIWGDKQTEYICIKFSPEILYTADRLVFESRYVLPFTMASESPQKVFKRIEIDSTPLPHLIRESYQEMLEQAYGYELAVRTNISRIFLWVLRHWQSRGITVDGKWRLKDKDMERLKVVFDCLDRDYMQPLTAEQMARLCNMSYSYFSRHFKAAMGKSFTSYLNYVRITEAEKLLLSSDLTITEIAMETGFSSVSYFISQFRQQKNMSPRRYRRQISLPV